MKPTSLVPPSVSSATGGGQLADSNPALKAVVTIGSAFLLVGLVGLAVLGFMITRKDDSQKKQNRT
jgi:hypothetical protein